MSPPSRAAALRRAPAPVPEHPIRRRLRLVEAQRPAIPASTAALAVAFVVTVLFSVVAFHTLLVSNQSAIDEMDRQIEQQEELRQQLVLREAQLSAPQRIVQVAERDLGMVTPAEVVWLEPVSLDEAPDAP